MVLFHALLTYLDNTFVRIVSLLFFCLILILNHIKKVNLAGFLLFKIMVITHIIYHAICLMLESYIHLPIWLIWIELVLFVFTLMILITEIGFRKGFANFFILLLLWIATNVLVEFIFSFQIISAIIIGIMAVIFILISI